MDILKPMLIAMRKHSYLCLDYGKLTVFCFLIQISSTGSLLQDQYIGCFYESGSNALQPAVVANDNALTIEKCIGQCQRLSNNTYAGLQNGTSCFCLADYGVELPDTTCSITCSGNPLQYCGGSIHQSLAYVVYTVCPIGNYGPLCDKVCHCKRQVTCDRMTGICPDGCHGNWSGPACDTKTVSDQYIGCYRDNEKSLSPNNRALNASIFYNQNSVNTIELCIESCALTNASYAGMQFSVQCFCGESYDRFGRINESECAMSCSGNAAEICGGPDANSVYSICPVGNFGKWCLRSCNCLDNRRCVYENGSCPLNQCQSGWAGNNCNNRDCTVNNGGCYTNETCFNINLQYAHLSTCRCSTGFQRSKTWSNCTDIDECSRESAICDSKSEVCINTIGSYICNKTGLTTCTYEKQGLYSVGAVIGVGIGSAVGSAVIVSLICIGIILSRQRQRQKQGTKSIEIADSRSQSAAGTKVENPFPLTDGYETLSRRGEEEEHSYSTIKST